MDTFQITIQRVAEAGWPVVVEWSDSKTSFPVRTGGLFQFDQTVLNSQVTPRDYGTVLGQALFRDDVRDAFIRARTESEDHLSVLLFVEDFHVRTLRWERLCAPLDNGWDFLSLNQRTPFSLYLPSATERRFPPFGRRDLRALVVVASPEGLERYRLTPFDVETAVTSVRAALGTIPCDVLATAKEAVGPPTLDAICDRITTTPYTLLHFVCHGRYFAESGETVLYLAGANQQAEPISATQLVERFKRLGGARGLPHFAFLATCESASPQAEGALGGLAQRLVRELGMPAVLAMTEQVSLSTAQVLAQGFYRQLRIHGQVDLALVEACAGLLGRADITVPALYSRLGARLLFTDALDRDLTSDDLRLGLSRLKDLFLERAPILWELVRKPLKTIQESAGKTATLSEAGRSERKRAFEEINLLCLEALDLSFHALALGEDPPPYDSRCPFRGLAAFGPEHQEFFFGRERLIARLQQRLSHHSFLAVVGSSGCGKSSLVLAGVVPAMQRTEPGLQFIAMTPGSEPLEQLQGSLAQVEASRPCVLVVDQFEELFTLCPSEQKRQAFLKALLTLVNKHQVIITMRADFIVDCAPYHALKSLLQEHLELVAPMDTAELREAMELQVAAVGLRFDADLSSRILDDVEREPAAMPLLQHALLELWKRRHGHWLRAEEYRTIGGIQQAISRTADTVYEGLEPAEQKRTQEIFVRLTKPDVDALPGEERRDTRQRVWLDELVPAGHDLEATKGLVKRLADARLVVVSVNSVTGREEVEVAHEALIRHWPRLRSWLNEERDSLHLRQKIREAAREWEQHGKPKDRLYRGSQLKEARVWVSRNAPSKNEGAFLQASVAQRRQSLFSMAAAVLLALLVLLPTAVVLIRPPWCPTLLCPPSGIVTNPQGVHDRNLDLYLTAIQSTAYVIPGSLTQYSLKHLPESIGAMRTDGKAIDPNTPFSPYYVVLGIHSLQKDHAMVIERVALVVRRALPLSYPLNVLIEGPLRNYTNHLYQVIYLGQEQGATLAAASALAGSSVQLDHGDADSLTIQVASPVSIDLQFALQVTYRVINESQVHTLILPQVFEITFFAASSNWHLYRFQDGHFVEAYTP